MKKVALLLALLLAGCSSVSTEDLRGSVREPAPQVGEFTLTAASDGDVDQALRAEEGKLLLLFFGFTYCPDICPTTMADIRTALEDLGADSERIQTSMVTVDPQRDSGPVLTEYVHRFVPDGLALRTDDQAKLTSITKAFGASYEVKADPDPEKYEVGHTAWLYAIDDAGQLRIQWSYGTSSEDIAYDLETLLELIDQGKSA